jgi:DNA integrity scanning protein DisA with diadenylate cyclase activity
MWTIHWQTLIDFSVLALAVYLLLEWAMRARALRVALGIVALRAAAIVAQQFDLALTAWVLNASTAVALILLLVVFQSELRHALLHLDITLQRWRTRGGWLDHGLIAISEAAFSLADSGRGALIVIVRQNSVHELITGGVPVGGEISKAILEAIFRRVLPVHDGAAIIERNRIARVAAILPLTEVEDLPDHWGTRHRAAFGLVERSDAVVIVVSEEGPMPRYMSFLYTAPARHSIKAAYK